MVLKSRCGLFVPPVTKRRANVTLHLLRFAYILLLWFGKRRRTNETRFQRAVVRVRTCVCVWCVHLRHVVSRRLSLTGPSLLYLGSANVRSIITRAVHGQKNVFACSGRRNNNDSSRFFDENRSYVLSWESQRTGQSTGAFSSSAVQSLRVFAEENKNYELLDDSDTIPLSI